VRRGTVDKYKELTAQGPEAYVSALGEIGWFEVSGKSPTELRAQLTKAQLAGQESSFYMRNLSDLRFDTEGYSDPAEYEYVLKKIIKVIDLPDSALTVSYVVEWETVEVEIRGGSGTYRYAVDVSERSDWFDGKVIEDFVNDEVLAGEGIRSRFLILPPLDQYAAFVLVPPDVFYRAVDRGIIPDSPEYVL
jgi:hypothetical protein